ncbi:MAG: hypothetical protein QXO17_00875 [Nitrososphaerota archaeon]|nr:hypothetical protein [Candidatus Calditenuis fumarioli]
MFSDQTLLEAVLAASVAFTHGWSTGSLIVSLTRSGMGARRSAAAVLLGGLLGTVIGGRGVTHTAIFSEGASRLDLTTVLLITLLLLIAGSLTSTPVSYSHVLVMTMMGWVLRSGAPINPSGVAYLLMGWVAGPFIAASISISLYALVKQLFRRLDVLTVDAINRASIYVASFALTYSVAGNNMGFLASLVSGWGWPVAHAVVAIFWTLGVLLPGKAMWDFIAERVARMPPQGIASAAVGSSLTMWIFLLLSVPTSVSHYVLASAALLPLLTPHLVGWRSVARVVLWSAATSLLGFTAAWLV